MAAPLLSIIAISEEEVAFRKALEALRVLNEVVAVGDVFAAIRVLEQSEPAEVPLIAFFSLTVPEVHRLLAWLEVNSDHRPRGVIGMTTFHDIRPVMQAYHLGVTAFLQVPVKTRDLANALASLQGIIAEDRSDGCLLRCQ